MLAPYLFWGGQLKNNKENANKYWAFIEVVVNK